MKRLVSTTLALVLLACASARAANFTVTTQADAPAATPCAVAGSLRCAWTLAQSNTEADVITVPAGTYPLTSGTLSMPLANEEITLFGAGAGTTILRGSGSDRLLTVTGAGGVVDVFGMTLSDGVAPAVSGLGGAAFVGQGAAVNLLSARITKGQASSGGGVYASGDLAAVGSVIDNNVAQGTGGGAFFEGRLDLINSTVALNVAAVGGGIATGVTTGTRTLQLVHATVARNRASETGAGLALQSPGTFEAWATIVADNLRGVDQSNCTGTPPTPPPGFGANVESAAECGFNVQNAAAGLSPDLVDAGGATPVLTIPATSPAAGLERPCSPGIGIDQRGASRPADACDAGAFEEGGVLPGTPPPPVVTPSPAPVATPTATAVPTPVPTPVFAKDVVVAPVEGKVRVREKGSNRFVDLVAGDSIPLGSTVDTKEGKVRLTSLAKKNGTPQTADFFDGIFTVGQTGATTDLVLSEALAPCPKGGGKASGAAAKPKSRKLWGSGSGNFRTRGHYSAATVRGTTWLVQDTCAGTLTRVTKGSVLVRDQVKRRNIILRAGKRYLARPRR